MKIPPWMKETIVHFSIEIYPFFLLLCFSDSMDTAALKVLFIMSLPISILQASAIAALVRMSTELNSEDWRAPADLSFYTRLVMLAGSTAVAYFPESIPRNLVLIIFVAVDVYITKKVLDSSAALRERFEAKPKTTNKQ